MIHLADAVGASGLAFYAIVAMVLFIIAFLLILIPILAPGRAARYERARLLPLDEPPPHTARDR